MRATRLLVPLALGAALLSPAGIAHAGPSKTATDNPGTTVYEHGGSNLGECSAYLATVLGVRDDINHTIKEYGSFLGISSPGELYSVRARQQVNLPPAQECLARALPGGGTG